MNTIYADFSISMSEFKTSPMQALHAAGGAPVAVLNHYGPAFYIVTPELFEAMVQELEDQNLAAIARQRLALKDTAIEVDIQEI